MLRTLHVPTRNVTGFVGGTYNRFGRYYAVREGDAHSWVEAYIDDPYRAWHTFDPTPTAGARPLQETTGAYVYLFGGGGSDSILRFDPVTRSMVPARDGSLEDRSTISPDRNNFGPRLGFAYTITPENGGYFHLLASASTFSKTASNRACLPLKWW